jgi:hypothetical protein
VSDADPRIPELDLAELAEDAGELADDGLANLAGIKDLQPLEAEGFALLYGLPWTMGERRPEATTILIEAVARHASPDAVDVLDAIARLYPMATDAARAAIARLGIEGRRTRSSFSAARGVRLDMGGMEAVWLAISVGTGGMGQLATVIAAKGGGWNGLTGGVHEELRPLDQVVDGLEEIAGQVAEAQVEWLDRAQAREAVGGLMRWAAEEELSQREGIVLDRPLIAAALGEDLGAWPPLPIEPEDDHGHDEHGPGGGAGRPSSASPGARKARRRRAQKAARKKNRRRR